MYIYPYLPVKPTFLRHRAQRFFFFLDSLSVSLPSKHSSASPLLTDPSATALLTPTSLSWSSLLTCLKNYNQLLFFYDCFLKYFFNVLFFNLIERLWVEGKTTFYSIERRIFKYKNLKLLLDKITINWNAELTFTIYKTSFVQIQLVSKTFVILLFIIS